MDYQTIDIQTKKRRYVERIPVEGLPGRTKDVVTSENAVLIHLCGLKVPDPAFVFEFQAILEEFIAKKLNSYKETTVLNSILDTENDEIQFYITRKESLLLITLQDREDFIQAVVELDTLRAKLCPPCCTRLFTPWNYTEKEQPCTLTKRRLLP